MRLCLVCAVLCVAASTAFAQDSISYRVVATSKTSTMQKEMQEAGDTGYRFVAVMGERFEYKLLATSKTSTMEKELRELVEGGYQAIGLTVGKTALGGSELVVISRRERP